MSGSPAQPPAPQDVQLHERLRARDPTAGDDLATAYLDALAAWLGEVDAGVASDTRLEAAENALLALIRNPDSYRPEGQTLEVYLRMSARGDLRNLLSQEQRHHRDRVPWASVEHSPDAGKYLGREDDPSLALCLAEATEDAVKAIPDSVRRELPAADLRALEFILRKERRTAVYAELYGLLHLPAREQFLQVKRHKDRLKKVLERAGRKA
jgi:RNA polymerase sigma-70 factor (ECF subfamily)